MEGLEDIFERAGIDVPEGVDPFEMLRASGPVDQEVWLHVAEHALGWKFSSVDFGATGHGAKVAVAVDAEGREWPVHMSPISYNPGDDEDATAVDLMERIEGMGERAVVVFKPGMSLQKRGGDRRIVYGGRLLMDGAWSDFVLKRDGGLDDAIAQRPLWDDGRPADELYETHGADERRLVRFLVDGEPDADGTFAGVPFRRHGKRRTRHGAGR